MPPGRRWRTFSASGNCAAPASGRSRSGRPDGSWGGPASTTRSASTGRASRSGGPSIRPSGAAGTLPRLESPPGTTASANSGWTACIRASSPRTWRHRRWPAGSASPCSRNGPWRGSRRRRTASGWASAPMRAAVGRGAQQLAEQGSSQPRRAAVSRWGRQSADQGSSQPMTTGVLRPSSSTISNPSQSPDSTSRPTAP